MQRANDAGKKVGCEAWRGVAAGRAESCGCGTLCCVCSLRHSRACFRTDEGGGKRGGNKRGVMGVVGVVGWRRASGVGIGCTKKSGLRDGAGDRLSGKQRKARPSKARQGKARQGQQGEAF